MLFQPSFCYCFHVVTGFCFPFVAQSVSRVESAPGMSQF